MTDLKKDRAADLAFALRKVAEAWWALADAVEGGECDASARLIALVNICETVADRTLGALGSGSR